MSASAANGSGETFKAASQLERAMRGLPKLAVLHARYRHLKELYSGSEARARAPASPRKELEACQGAADELFAMQVLADHLVRELSPALAERRMDADTRARVAVARSASTASQAHGYRLAVLGLEGAFLRSLGGGQVRQAKASAPASSAKPSLQLPSINHMPVRSRYADSLWRPPQKPSP